MQTQKVHLFHQIEQGLHSYNNHIRPLPLLRNTEVAKELIEVMCKSAYHTQTLARLRHYTPEKQLCLPDSVHFDPLDTAIMYYQQSAIGEAWLFYATSESFKTAFQIPIPFNGR